VNSQHNDVPDAREDSHIGMDRTGQGNSSYLVPDFSICRLPPDIAVKHDEGVIAWDGLLLDGSGVKSLIGQRMKWRKNR
jgi:hypothetical protein